MARYKPVEPALVEVAAGEIVRADSSGFEYAVN